MQINPKYRNNPTFNKALSTYSEATSSKKMGALGKNTISYSKEDEIAEQYQRKDIKHRQLFKNTFKLCWVVESN